LEQLSNTAGFLSAILFITANAYYPAKLIARHVIGWDKEMTIFFSKYLKLHISSNLLAFFFLLIHAHYAEEKTALLGLSFVVTFLLTIEGVLMHYKVFPEDNKYIRMLHTQQALFWIWIGLIIIGHMKVI